MVFAIDHSYGINSCSNTPILHWDQLDVIGQINLQMESDTINANKLPKIIQATLWMLHSLQATSPNTIEELSEEL